MFSVFANFRIDTPDRLIATKLSFKSFNDEKVKNWIINVRGKYKREIKKFLIKNCKSRIKVYHVETRKGWMHDSKQLVKYLESDYVLFWFEDHICQKNKIKYLFNCALDMKKNNVDQLLYTFWHKGRNLRNLQNIGSKKTSNIVFYNLNKKTLQQVQNNRVKIGMDKLGFIVNAPSIFQKDFFIKLITIRKPWIRRYNKLLPFNFEKRISDDYWLPFVNAHPLKEIFISVDDDHGVKGYSLISRNLYKKKFNRNTEVELREKINVRKNNLYERIKYKILNNLDF
jgi:hypothetical protein